MCLTRALLQQETVGRHWLEARLEELSQRQPLLVVLPVGRRRRQGLENWRHLRWNGIGMGAVAASVGAGCVRCRRGPFRLEGSRGADWQEEERG